MKTTTWTNGKPDLSSSTLEYYYKVKTQYYEDSNFTDYHSGGTLYGVQYVVNH